MARGKQAALAASRRYEAAVAHIDRLTSELVDAKLRARQHEAAAVQLPVLQAEIARLRQQVTDGTSDELQQAEARQAKAMKDLRAENDEFRAVIKHILDIPEVAKIPCLTKPMGLLLSRTGLYDGLDASDGVGVNRELRRARAFSRTADDLNEHDRQDNRRTQAENDARRWGTALINWGTKPMSKPGSESA